MAALPQTIGRTAVIKEKADAAIGKAEKLFDRKDSSLEKGLRDLCAENDANALAVSNR
jgi:hypothetical protein